MKCPAVAPPRRYRMTVRAEAAARTGDAIVEAAIALLGERPYDEVALADVARAAAVTVPTVLRRFGSKEGLVEAALAHATAEVRAQRWAPPAGDLRATVAALATHYETWGDRVRHLLAQEGRSPAIRAVTDAGRALHRELVVDAFAPWLRRRRSAAVRARLRARLVAVTDLAVWTIFRRDLGMDAATAETTLRELIEAALA